MITGIVCFVGGLFFQQRFPAIGDTIVSKVASAARGLKAWATKAKNDVPPAQ